MLNNEHKFTESHESKKIKIFERFEQICIISRRRRLKLECASRRNLTNHSKSNKSKKIKKI